MLFLTFDRSEDAKGLDFIALQRLPATPDASKFANAARWYQAASQLAAQEEKQRLANARKVCVMRFRA